MLVQLNLRYIWCLWTFAGALISPNLWWITVCQLSARTNVGTLVAWSVSALLCGPTNKIGFDNDFPCWVFTIASLLFTTSPNFLMQRVCVETILCTFADLFSLSNPIYLDRMRIAIDKSRPNYFYRGFFIFDEKHFDTC